jgi:hypothetical protein
VIREVACRRKKFQLQVKSHSAAPYRLSPIIPALPSLFLLHFGLELT